MNYVDHLESKFFVKLCKATSVFILALSPTYFNAFYILFLKLLVYKFNIIALYNIIYYFDFSDLNKLKSILSEMVSAIVAEFLQPEVNGLIAREE